MRATLSTDACAKNWRGAYEDPESPRAHNCRGCPIGASHAGETAASTSPLRGASICGRCQRMTERLVYGHLCVSCYNRQAEVLAGKNAKGKKPVKLGKLEPRRIRITAGGEPQYVALPLTTSNDELFVKALRDSSHEVVFCWDPAAPALFNQGTLF